MNGEHNPLHLLQQVHSGALAPEDALLQLKLPPLRIWAMLKLTVTAPSARGRRRFYTAPEKPRSSCWASSLPWPGRAAKTF